MPDRNLLLVALGQAVRQLREEKSLSPSDLAAAADLGLDQIEAIEHGELDPSYDELVALAESLEVAKITLFDRAEELGDSARSASQEHEGGSQ